eukprot:2821186-Rhodomonas_salina.1
MALPISLSTLAYWPSMMADVPAAVCADLNQSYARNTTVCLPKLCETFHLELIVCLQHHSVLSLIHISEPTRPRLI